MLLLSPLSVDVAVASEGSKMYWMVQRTDLWASEEILILLHHAGENEFSRKELGKYGMHDPPGITGALKALTASAVRQVILLTSGRYRLTDLRSEYLREGLSDKLLLD